MTGYAIDVSHHQDPEALPWRRFEGHVDAVLVRACYGAELRDKHAHEHVRRARDIGAKVGLYMFFRNIHSVQKQFYLFRSVADSVGLRESDIVPVIDIEHDPIPKPGSDVSPSWSKPAQELCDRIRELYSDCMIYITQREWGMLGKPQWVLERPLWVAHYTHAVAPASPAGKPPVIWQHRVGPFVPNGPGGYDKSRPELDQNRILGPLPLITRKPPDSFLLIDTNDTRDDEWDELRERVALAQFDWRDLLDGVDDEPIPDTEPAT